MIPKLPALGSVTAALLAMAIAAPASGDEADAKAILKAMSDYLAAQETFAFDYDSMLEVVTTENQKLGLAASGTVTVARPDRLRATRTGGFADVEIVFDGATFTLLGKHAGVYGQLAAKGSLDALIDTLRDDHGLPLPAADLLVADPYSALTEGVTDVKDLGSGVIGGRECDHLAFRTEFADWQIWIAHGDAPFPCRYMITTPSVAQAPQYSVDIRDWRPGGEVASEAFAFTPPEGATLIDLTALRGQAGDLPPHFTLGD